MKKCMWCTEDGWCELRDGIADDASCNGSEEEMQECNYVESTAEFDSREVEDVIKDWLR